MSAEHHQWGGQLIARVPLTGGGERKKERGRKAMDEWTKLLFPLRVCNSHLSLCAILALARDCSVANVWVLKWVNMDVVQILSSGSAKNRTGIDPAIKSPQVFLCSTFWFGDDNSEEAQSDTRSFNDRHSRTSSLPLLSVFCLFSIHRETLLLLILWSMYKDVKLRYCNSFSHVRLSPHLYYSRVLVLSMQETESKRRVKGWYINRSDRSLDNMNLHVFPLKMYQLSLSLTQKGAKIRLVSLTFLTQVRNLSVMTGMPEGSSQSFTQNWSKKKIWSYT